MTNMQMNVVGSQTPIEQKQNTLNSTVDYDAFLTLLVAEMRNQDPTNPTDSKDYMAQLASFSNVEQAIQTNAKLDELINRSALGDVSSLIGQTATSADGSVSGRILSVTLGADSMTANLENGETLLIGPGVTIS